jgi:tRNA (pseudouridine54-N1)-methyltransferase
MAVASGDFLLDDLPGTSGRLDVLVRCIRAALLTSHGLRRDAVVYLVLGGGPRAPLTVRVSGPTAKFIRPDERALATLLEKSLHTYIASTRPGFVSEGELGFLEVRAGVGVAAGGLEAVLADAAGPVAGGQLYVLEETGPDIREEPALAAGGDALFVLGDHLGFDDATRAALAAAGARPLGLGPVSIHTDDAIAVLSNELDRRGV